MVQLASGWEFNVDRGPGWLFVKVRSDDPSSPQDLAEMLWNLLRQHFTNRLVLEMNELPPISAAVAEQLVALQEKIREGGGILRLAGMSDENQQLLDACRLDMCFPQYENRASAVMGRCEAKV